MLMKTVDFIIAKSKYIRRCSTLSSAVSKWKEPVGYDTGIKIYNCVAKKKVPLILRNKNLVTCYSCGPTVYDSAHIGHAVCYLKFDIILRILKEYFDIQLVTVMGVTDVDDKIIKRAQEIGQPFNVLAKRYEKEFFDDMNHFGIVPSHMLARVTDYIPHIISFIQKLIDKGYAYSAEDGSVYFTTSKYQNYGKLENIVIDDKKKKNKEYSSDFALWKGAKENEPHWDAPWGKGRPGWHIECSVMASHLLGNVIDIHTGGVDLRFPHHENEEAQSCTYHENDQWVNYWMHIGHLKVKDLGKMSKSLKNTVCVSEYLEKYSPDVLRVACLLSHYRSHMLYSDEYMDHSLSIYNKIYLFLNDCNAYTSGKKSRVNIDEAFLFFQVDKMNKTIEIALKDDFDTAKCMNAILELIHCVNKIFNSGRPDSHRYSIAESYCMVSMVRSSITDNLKLFGIDMDKTNEGAQQNIDHSNLLNNIVKVRDGIRQIAIREKQKSMFEFCDRIRDDLKAVGIEIKDQGKVSSWYFSNRNKEIKYNKCNK